MSDFKIAGKQWIQATAEAIQECAKEGMTKHHVATQALFEHMKSIPNRITAKALLQVPPDLVCPAFNFVNDPDKRLASLLLAQLLSQQLHYATPNMESLGKMMEEIDHTLTPPVLAETLAAKPIKDVSEYNNRIPSTLSLSFDANHQLISKENNNVPWVETTKPYTGRASLHDISDVLELYSVTDSEGKKLKIPELGAPFLNVTTNPLNNLLNERNKDFLYQLDNDDPITERNIKLPEIITITTVDSRTDKKTGEITKIPGNRAYILTLQESAINQAQQGRDIVHPTALDPRAKVLK
jgi:hypothetical protein